MTETYCILVLEKMLYLHCVNYENKKGGHKQSKRQKRQQHLNEKRKPHKADIRQIK